VQLYIHIPFCDSKCHYCAFNSYVGLYHLKPKFMEALYKQLEYEITKQTNLKVFDSIFIGGGTPSCIDAGEYKKIFTFLKPYIDKNTEITTEANPNSANRKWQEGMFDLGVNRISFGVQSFDNKKLDFLNRSHSQTQAIEAINKAKEIGFKHINCDIIYDTSMDSEELLQNDLLIIKDLPIDHISAYSLTLEEGTKFFNKSSVKKENLPLTNFFFDELKALGFKQYEISNFAKSDISRSKHNFGYWEYKSYLGVGAGAVACYDNNRYYNEKDLEKYILNPLEFVEVEHLSDEDIIVEKVLLGLRSLAGVSLDLFDDDQLKRIEILEDNDKIEKQNNKIYSRDFLLADELSLYILDGN
jgi:oxygen-independent coproporphyrinogen-3 oxidase